MPWKTIQQVTWLGNQHSWVRVLFGLVLAHIASSRRQPSQTLVIGNIAGVKLVELCIAHCCCAIVIANIVVPAGGWNCMAVLVISGYCIDITIPAQRIAIEADGPSHMARTGDGTRLLGATAMKHRHLELLGWSVINITYLEWKQLKTEEERAQYMKAHIQQAMKAS